MGEHKYNPTAIKAKNGELKSKKKLSANHITKAKLYEMIKDKIPVYRELEKAIVHDTDGDIYI